jgi:hypothetical protein
MRCAAVLALVVALIGLIGATGCDDDPTCHLLVNLSGGQSGELAWSLAGTDQCGLADAAVLADGAQALVFVDRSSDTPLQFFISVVGGLPAVGTYMGQVVFVTPDGIWQSDVDACTVEVVTREREDWSRTDFIMINGVVDCPGGLQPVGGGTTVTMSTMVYSGHVYNETLDFGAL